MGVHLRIIASIFALAVLAATVLGAYYFYEKSLRPEEHRRKTVENLLNIKAPTVDPGKKEFDRAINAIRGQDFDTARQKLTQIMEIYPDSARYADARRVLGEMNADLLFSIADRPGNLKGTQEYSVARGQSLAGIAQKYRTTIPFIRRINNLAGNVIKPDERLILYPLDFTLKVDLQGRRLTLEKDGGYFKDYPLVSFRLEGRIPSDTMVGDVQGTAQPGTKKVIKTTTKGGRTGVIFTIPEEVAAGGAEPHGIFLALPDMEELATLVRQGTPVVFVKPKAAS